MGIYCVRFDVVCSFKAVILIEERVREAKFIAILLKPNKSSIFSML